MFCSKGRCDVNSCPAHYDEDYWDVEEPEQRPRSGRSQLRAGQEYESNVTATVSNIQNAQQFLNSLKNLQTLTQNLIVAFDQVAIDGRTLRQNYNSNSHQATRDWIAGIPDNFQPSPYPSGAYPPAAYQPSPYPTTAYQANNFAPNACVPSGQLPISNFEDSAFHKRFGLPPPIRPLETQNFLPDYNEVQTTSRSNQGYDNDNSDYRTINVPVLLEVSFDGKEAEITKVMHITDTGYPALSQESPELPPELICGDDQQADYPQSEYPALNEGPSKNPLQELSSPIERQRDSSRPLPKPQQKDLKRCVSCHCDECPVYFTDSDIPECPNDCGCCNCDIKIIKIREAQKKIKICKCTGVAGPCKCKPTLDECTCMKLAEKYLDALDERSVLGRPEVKEIEKAEEIPKYQTEPDTNVPIPRDNVKTEFVKCPEECPPDCTKCAEKKKNLNEPKEEVKEEKPDKNVPIPPDNVKTEFVKCPEECPPDCTKCAEKKKNLNEPKEVKEDKPDKNVPIPPDNVKTEFVKCPEECPPDCTKCAEKKKNLNEPKQELKEDEPDKNAPIPPDHVKTEFVKCPEECPSDCIQCAEKKKNLNEPKKEFEEAKKKRFADGKQDTKDDIDAADDQEEHIKVKKVGSNESLCFESISGYEIPPNCIKFLQYLYTEMKRVQEAKHLRAQKEPQQKEEGKEDEQGKDEKQEKESKKGDEEKQEKEEHEEVKISVKEEAAEERTEKEEDVKEEPKEEMEIVEVKTEQEEVPQKEEEPVKEEKEEKEPDKGEEIAEQEEKVDEVVEEAEKPDKEQEEKVEKDGEKAEEQEEKEVKEEKYVKEDKNKKTKSKTERGASKEVGEKKDAKSKDLSPASKKKGETGCMCHIQKPKEQQPQRPASFLLELSGDINKILTKKSHKSKTCCCDGKFDYSSQVDQRRTDLTSRIREKLCSDQSGLGDMYVSTRARQNQIEASQDSKPCCNKRLSYGYSLDNQLKEFEDKKVNSPEVLKMFVEDISKDIKAMKSTLNRGLFSRRSARGRFSIWVDDCCKTRLHASGYDSGCVYSVDVTKRHTIVLHPIPTEDCLKKRKAKCKCLKCKILPDFSEPKPKLKRPPLPETWTPSIYIYDPTCPSKDSNFSIDEGPCCCV